MAFPVGWEEMVGEGWKGPPESLKLEAVKQFCFVYPHSICLCLFPLRTMTVILCPTWEGIEDRCLQPPDSAGQRFAMGTVASGWASWVAHSERKQADRWPKGPGGFLMPAVRSQPRLVQACLRGRNVTVQEGSHLRATSVTSLHTLGRVKPDLP